MIHINEISWAQLILIEMGAMFQLAALCAFVKEAAKPNRVIPGARESQIVHEEEARCKLSEAPLPAHVVQSHRETHGVMEDAHADVAPGRLAKTAKVNFKQTFKMVR
jgi:hypothetical protein